MARTPNHLKARFRTMDVSRIKQDAPPGPGMTEAEFKHALQHMADDAARWRWLRKNLTRALEWKLEHMAGGELQEAVDAARRA